MRKSTAAKPFKFKKLLIILGAVLGALGIIAGIGALTNWFGLYGPADQIALAAKNTLTAESFTITVELHNEFPYDRRHHSTDEIVTCQVVQDPQNRDIQLYLEHDDIWGNKEILAIYQKTCIIYRQGQYTTFDCSSQIETYFNTRQRIDGLIKDLSGKKPDYDKAVSNAVDNQHLYDIIEEQVDFDTIADCFSAVRKQVNKRTWLKDEFEFKTKKNGDTKQYLFHISDMDFAGDILELTEDAFANKLAYNYVEDFVDDMELEYPLDVTIGVQDNQLRYIEAERDYKDDRISCHDKFSITFTEIGTTKIDTIKLQALLEAAKAAG